MMRLRQIAVVTEDLRGIEREICDQLGLEVCYRDPGLSHFGLRHGLYAIGDQILEVVAPKQPGTTAGRFLERREGEGGAKRRSPLCVVARRRLQRARQERA